jgi:hypothetical protein
MNTITPLQLMMLMHYRALHEPYSAHNQEHANSSAVRSQRQDLISHGLLRVTAHKTRGYEITERGEAHVQAMLKVPFPVLETHWVTPKVGD